MTAIPIQLSVRPPGSEPIPAEWPNEAWKAGVVARDDWRPLPFRQFIIKTHSRCNLSCDYCYIYEMADQSWKTMPVGGMTRETVTRAAKRIGEFAARHEIPVVEVTYHGGEPLLVGRDFIDFASDTFQAAMPAGTRVALGVQTNGVLLDDKMLEVLGRHDVHLGISLDGSRAANDRHRRYPNGKSSYQLVADAIDRVNAGYRELFAMIICTIDAANDPVDTYESLLGFRPPALDFLLPLGNWTTPPPLFPATAGAAPYGDWLAALFDRWYGAPVQETQVRVLQAVVDRVLGAPSRYEMIGLSPAAAIEVETDGSMHQVCTLKSTYDGATCTGLSVFSHTFDDAMAHPAVVARQAGLQALADDCLRCPIRDICGGGYYAHRYKEGTGFLNRSVYCADLIRLIGHVRGRISADLAPLTQGGAR